MIAGLGSATGGLEKRYGASCAAKSAAEIPGNKNDRVGRAELPPGLMKVLMLGDLAKGLEPEDKLLPAILNCHTAPPGFKLRVRV